MLFRFNVLTIRKINKNMSTFFIIESILLFLIVFLIVGIIILIVKSWRFRPQFDIGRGLHLPAVNDATKAYQKIVSQKWEQIIQRAAGKDEKSYRLAILEADGLIDESLQKGGYQGKDMAERLKTIHPNELKNLDALWEAHKIRNRIAHEADFRLSISEAERILEIYQAVLKEFELL